MNTGARLQSAAPPAGSSSASTTYRATERAIEYEAHEPVTAKGKAEPLLAWRAVSRRASWGIDLSDVRSPLVGRDDERDVLVGALARARTRREPQLVTVVGVPGIGKSRLVRELFRVVDDDPELIVWRQGARSRTVRARRSGDLPRSSRRKRASSSRTVPTTPWRSSPVCRPPPRRRRPRARGSGDTSSASTRRPADAVVGPSEPRRVVRRGGAASWSARRSTAGGPRLRGPPVGGRRLLDFVDELVDRVTDVPLLVVATATAGAARAQAGVGRRQAKRVDDLARASPDETRRVFSPLLRSPRPAGRAAALRCSHTRRQSALRRGVRACSRPAAHRRLSRDAPGLVAARVDGTAGGGEEAPPAAAVLGEVFWTRCSGGPLDGVPWALRRALRTRSSARSSSGASGARRWPAARSTPLRSRARA